MTAGVHDGEAPYFLSAANPAATVDQRDLEDLTARLMARSDVQAACAMAKAAWRSVTEFQMPPQQWALFDDAMLDYCTRGVLLAANSDAGHPRVLRVYMPKGRWFGRASPGSKWGGENPDNAYRIMPVEAGARYEILGRRQPQPSAYVTFQLVGNTTTSQTLASLEQRDVQIGPDGDYVLTLGPEPADGRANHIQLPDGVKYVFVRDSMGDWLTQTPDALRTRRLTAPSRPPLDEDELARRAVVAVVWDVSYAYFASRIFLNKPQAMMAPISPAAVGGLVTQVNSPGNFHIEKDEAVVITATNNGAAYRSLVLHDLFIRTLEYRDRQTSLNQGQAVIDPNGRTTTYVIAHRDPGVANWLDTTDMTDVTLLYRWQGLPSTGPVGAIEIKADVVKLDALEAALPPGLQRLTPAERRDELARRAAGYDRRFLDH